MNLVEKPSEDTDDVSGEWEDLDAADSDSESVDDEENDTSSWSQELRESWKQHLLAIFIAILATGATHTYQRQQGRRSNSSVQDGVQSGFPAPTLHMSVTAPSAAHIAHSHLLDYSRTANITFCSDISTDVASTQDTLRETDRLAVMDFHIPQDLLEAMQGYFHADILRDDTYELLENMEKLSSLQHEQVDCMQQQLASSSQKSYIRGVTHFAKTPSLQSMYPEYNAEEEAKSLASGLSRKPLESVHLSFTGFGAKFYNLSPQPVLLYWDGRNGGENRRLLGEIAPMESLGTATTPGQSFCVTPVYDSDHALHRWTVTADEAVLYYDPPEQPKLTPQLERLYQMQKLNQEFAKHYLIHAKRTWLAQFPRAFPVHKMWDAAYFGQEHMVAIGSGPDRRRVSMQVKSVTPKVLTIDNFLSADECDAIIQLALAEGLHGSTVYAGSVTNHTHDRTTRSSSNSWLSRDTAELTDEIYQRAAQVLKMDANLFSKPIDDDVPAYAHSITESLQVVRYQQGEQYTAHHDFVYPSQRNRYQPTRFATLLFYLNDDFEGGHTIFPRAVNKNNRDGVNVRPKKGSAVLFYSILEDGNVDDLSQHASEPVESGEKYIANLWVWEPQIA